MVVAIAILGALSAPIVILWAQAAGSLAAMLGSAHRNLDFLDAYTSGWGRTDLVTLLSGGDPHALGAGVELAVMVAIVTFLAWRLRRSGGVVEDIAVAASLIAGMELVSVYHQSYDLLVLAVPVAMVVRCLLERRRSLDALALCVFGFLVSDLLSRPSIRYRVHDYAVVMNRYWPPVIAAAVFAAAVTALETSGKRSPNRTRPGGFGLP